MKTKHSGFTLLEILLVVGIIAILAGIVIVAINPSKQLATVRNTERISDIKQINSALTQYYIDHSRFPASVNGVSVLTEICNTGDLASSTVNVNDVDCGDLVNLSELVPVYITAIPVDPKGSAVAFLDPLIKTVEAATNGTGYFIKKDSTTNKPAIQAVRAELSIPIVINLANTTEATACTSFTYSSWSACSDNTKTRTVSTSNPSNCTGGVTPDLSDSCVMTYTVSFDTNGGTGSMSSQSINEGSSANLTANSFTRTGHTFSGWAASAGGSVAYANQASYTMGGANVTLYAKWVSTSCGGPTVDACWSPADYGRAWGPIGVTTGVLSEINGAANTATLAAITPGVYPAADYCDSLVYGGHSDWYLPAKQQLIDGMTNQLVNHGAVTGFTSDYYWSSTEKSGSPDNEAWIITYNSYYNEVREGGESYSNKDRGSIYTRCLR